MFFFCIQFKNEKYTEYYRMYMCGCLCCIYLFITVFTGNNFILLQLNLICLIYKNQSNCLHYSSVQYRLVKITVSFTYLEYKELMLSLT